MHIVNKTIINLCTLEKKKDWSWDCMENTIIYLVQLIPWFLKSFPSSNDGLNDALWFESAKNKSNIRVW